MCLAPTPCLLWRVALLSFLLFCFELHPPSNRPLISPTTPLPPRPPNPPPSVSLHSSLFHCPVSSKALIHLPLTTTPPQHLPRPTTNTTVKQSLVENKAEREAATLADGPGGLLRSFRRAGQSAPREHNTVSHSDGSLIYKSKQIIRQPNRPSWYRRLNSFQICVLRACSITLCNWSKQQ